MHDAELQISNILILILIIHFKKKPQNRTEIVLKAYIIEL